MSDQKTREFRWRYYKISNWLGLYFPVRFMLYVAVELYPRAVSGVVFEIVVLAVYPAD